MSHIANLNEAGVALQGYDPVSYFTGSPAAGQPEISSTFDGSLYYFASAENKGQFDAAPEKFIPQYGGFCAVAMSEGKTFPVDPKTYVISDDKLYLFYNGKLGNTLLQWQVKPDELRANADTHWQNHDFKVIYPTKDY